MKQKLEIILCLLLIILVFNNYSIVLQSTLEASTIWFYRVFPYLFIMIIIQDYLIKLNFSRYFKHPYIYILVMSIISGSPSSAIIISRMVKQNIIDKRYGNICLLFTFFANPLFLFLFFFSIFANGALVFKLISIYYISNFLILILNKNKLKDLAQRQSPEKFNLSSAINLSINTNLMVLGTITFYLILTNIILNNLNLSFFISTIFRGVLEMTQGLNALINNNILGKEMLAMFFISFGGLSIHTQVNCILKENDLDYKYFLKGRILQTIIALFLTFIT